MSKKFLRTLIAVLLVCCMLPMPTAFAESATVTGSDVNMRSGPGTNYPVVDCLPKGAAVTVTDMSNPDWYAVSYNGATGYMSSRYLKVSEESSQRRPPAQAGWRPRATSTPCTCASAPARAPATRSWVSTTSARA